MESELYVIPDTFGGFHIHPDHVEPANPKTYSQEVIARDREIVNQETWAAMHLDELNGPWEIRMTVAHIAAAWTHIYKLAL